MAGRSAVNNLAIMQVTQLLGRVGRDRSGGDVRPHTIAERQLFPLIARAAESVARACAAVSVVLFATNIRAINTTPRMSTCLILEPSVNMLATSIEFGWGRDVFGQPPCNMFVENLAVRQWLALQCHHSKPAPCFYCRWQLSLQWQFRC